MDMITGYIKISIMQERSRLYAILALCSLVSSGLGVLCSATWNHTYFSLMRMSAARPVTIVGSLIAVFVPYFVSVLVITNSKYRVAYILSSIRIFHLAAAYFAICCAFGSAGWLIGLMLLFPDIALIPMLLVISLRRVAGTLHKWDRAVGLVYTVIIGVINHCAVSPFLAKIITTFETNG